MKANRILITLALGVSWSLQGNINATTVSSFQLQPLAGASSVAFQPIEFRNSAEAGMLHRAYRILATGDHDYKGHRVKAMESVRAAADLLGVDLRGDGAGEKPQPLSDEKSREAQGLITQVLGAAEVKDQKRVVKHLNEAVRQINVALTVR